MGDFLIVVHACRDFATWKRGFDTDAPNRASAGLTDLLVLRETDDANRIALLFGVADRARAQAMIDGPALRQAMQAAGVVGAPEVRFVHGDFTPAPADTYLTMTAKVAAYETFLTAFAQDKSDRQAAGMTDLGVLHDLDDANNLFLIWSVDDVGRASRFLGSAKLHEHQVKDAGVIGPPEGHFWTR